MNQKYRLITDSNFIEKEEWDNFVENHSCGNIFHTSAMVSIYSQTEYYKPLTYFFIDQKNNIQALLIGYLLKEAGIKAFFSKRLIIWGGPLFLNNNNEIISPFLSEFYNKTKKSVIYSQFRNLSDLSHLTSYFVKAGYRFEDHLDILFDLSLPLEKLWNDIHPTRRKQISRGYRRGLSVSIVENYNEEIIERCAHLIISLYEKNRLPCPKEDFFHKASEGLLEGGLLKIFIASACDTVIGCRFVLCYKNLIYDWYAASDPLFLDRYPNDILPWEVVRWGNKNNFKTFDFGGAGKPNKPYGVRDYKLKFGGTLFNFGRFEKIHRPFLMFIGKIGYRLIKRAKIL